MGLGRGRGVKVTETNSLLEPRDTTTQLIKERIVEGWGNYNFYRDDLNFFMQLGVVEPTEEGKKLLP